MFCFLKKKERRLSLTDLKKIPSSTGNFSFGISTLHNTPSRSGKVKQKLEDYFTYYYLLTITKGVKQITRVDVVRGDSDALKGKTGIVLKKYLIVHCQTNHNNYSIFMSRCQVL